MKKSRIVAALVCASIGLTTGAVFAQPAPGGPDGYHDAHRAPGGPGGPTAKGGPGAPGHGPEMNGRDAPRPPQHANDEPRRDWRKGERLDNDYRSRQYVVDDWRGQGLRQPPRGYQWVGVGADYLLVAVASGVIAQVVLSH
ncbi:MULTISPECIES: RcnB family protein [Caballeronia]|jgi:Ni/Co efflux regulator RcnB|uniref:Integral membrane protein-like protein n=1 Tax=Caballeronia zhejiangensis TaxID=871203 RepID=A0A656QQN8_9BURK|nr:MULTISPECIES: RcnB family protein [Caballeronia]EKS70564.1 hypothetical protein BURK_011628 [Burkholderia sp. SJ98]KDR33625.1 hypothetical protein BG60_00135 [Caballeronia zhejiangensis]MDR5766558.1 RcnB family protein [Caballeronia sp. LZ028]MDR5788474.1 RcnB family protein [Caballeronia sp. LP003]